MSDFDPTLRAAGQDSPQPEHPYVWPPVMLRAQTPVPLAGATPPPRPASPTPFPGQSIGPQAVQRQAAPAPTTGAPEAHAAQPVTATGQTTAPAVPQATVDATVQAVIDATTRLDRAQAPTAERVRDMVPRILAEAARQGVSDPAQIAVMLANASHESQFNPARPENLNYTTTGRLRQIFPSHFHSEAEATPYTRNPEGLANRVYAGQDGNGAEASGDGWTYRGRGLIQTTHRGAYQRMTGLLRDNVRDAQGNPVDFEQNPDALSGTDASVAALVRGVSQGAFTQHGTLDDFLTRNQGRDAATFTAARRNFVGRADAGTVGDVTAAIYQAIQSLDFQPPQAQAGPPAPQ